jgi:hypothetical protein
MYLRAAGGRGKGVAPTGGVGLYLNSQINSQAEEREQIDHFATNNTDSAPRGVDPRGVKRGSPPRIRCGEPPLVSASTGGHTPADDAGATSANRGSYACGSTGGHTPADEAGATSANSRPRRPAAVAAATGVAAGSRKTGCAVAWESDLVR